MRERIPQKAPFITAVLSATLFFLLTVISSCRIQIVDPEGNPLSTARLNSLARMSSWGSINSSIRISSWGSISSSFKLSSWNPISSWNGFSSSLVIHYSSSNNVSYSSSRSSSGGYSSAISSSSAACYWVTTMTGQAPNVYSWLNTKANGLTDTVYSPSDLYPRNPIYLYGVQYDFNLIAAPMLVQQIPYPITPDPTIIAPPGSNNSSTSTYLCPGQPGFGTVAPYGTIDNRTPGDTIRKNYGPNATDTNSRFTVAILNKQELIDAFDTLDLSKPWIKKSVQLTHYQGDAAWVILNGPSLVTLYPSMPSSSTINFSSLYNPCPTGQVLNILPIIDETPLITINGGHYALSMLANSNTVPESSFTWEFWIRNQWGYRDFVRITTYITSAPGCISRPETYPVIN